MAIADEDKCPQCGTPYMSMLSPDDIIDTRICSTCDAEKGNAEYAANLGGGDNEELTLQGFEPDARDSKVPKKARIKSGNLRQQILADVRSKHRNERTTALREVKAAKAEAAQAAESAEVETQAEAPELSQDAPQSTPAGSGVRAAKSSGRLNPASRSSARGIPAAARASTSGMSAATKATGSGLNSATRASTSGMAPAARSGRTAVPPVSPVKTYITYGVIGVVVLVGGIIGLKAMSKPSAPAVTIAAAEPAKVLPKETPKEPKKEAEPEKIETAAPAVPAVVETPADPVVKEVEKKLEVSDVLGLNGARKSAKAKAGDDDEPVAAVSTTPAAVAPASVPGAEKPVDPAAPKAGAAKPPEKQSALAAITKKKPDEEPEPEKFVNKPPPVIPVTATEPSIVAIELEKMDMGPERSLTQTAQGAFPGWRIRDLNIQNSSIGSSFRGRDKVAALNPLNEKLGAKLIATIEIPKAFAGKRPMLLFEVASKDGNRDWVLSAKVKGMDMLKVAIKTKDEQPWIDQGVDLSPLIGLRFELTLEAATKQKKPKDMKEEMGYIRNIRLEWAGRAKPATPPPPAKKP